MKHSYTGGVTPMSISTRLVRERERLIGMTDEERAWRRQWLKDQVLSPNEPRYVPEYWRARTNIFRRIIRFPMDTLFKPLAPIVGADATFVLRHLTSKMLMGVGIVYGTWYYVKYNTHDWTKKGGWRFYSNRNVCLPGDPGYPRTTDKTKPADYFDCGFKNSPI